MGDLLRFVIFWIVAPIVLLLVIALTAHFHKGFGEHIRRSFTDAADKPSFTRMTSFIALLAVIAWQTHVVWKTGVAPTMIDCVIFIGAMFSIDRLPEIILAWKGTPSTKPAPAQSAAASA
jgi:hypothetical protein